MIMHRWMRWLAGLVAALALGCSSSPSTSANCLPGLRLCQGKSVVVCLETGTFAVTEICKSAEACQAGQCQSQLFSSDGGSLDASSKDTQGQDTGAVDTQLDAPKDSGKDGGLDSGVDAGLDTGKDSQAEPDAAFDAGLEVVEDAKADAVADAVADTVPDAKVDAAPDADDAMDANDVVDATADSSDVPPTPFAPGVLMYERLGNLAALDDLRKVAWHPGGKFALLLGTKGQVLRWDAGSKSIAALTTLGKDVVDLAADPAGAFFLVLGKNASNGTQVWRGTVDGSGLVAFAPEVVLSLGEPVAVAAEPGGTRFVFGTRTANPVVAYLTLWQDGKGLGTVKAFNSSGGLSDLMWAGTGLPGLSGSQAIVTSHGVNGADSRTWVLDANQVLSNGWSPGFGNGGGAGWRPGGSFGIVAGWSSNVVYVFDGTWQSTYLPGINNGASPQAIGWNNAGTRALVVGRATGSPLAATVFELRSGLSPSYSEFDWVNQSIAGFDKAPWAGNFSTYLLDAAWRPGGGCSEGLIVGSDTGPSGSPTFGTAIRFYDSADPACVPGP